MLIQFFNRFIHGSGELDRTYKEQDIERAIEIIVEETDPRISLVGGFRRALRKPVIRSLVYINDLTSRIPGAFQINRETFGSDPQVNALFGSVDDIGILVDHSKVLRTFFEDHPDCDVAYATLVMNRTDKKVFGMALHGDTVRKDVAQVSVNYSGHRLGICAPSEGELRQDLRWRGIHGLSITALEHITRMKLKADTLRKQSYLLKQKLRDIQSQRRGLDAIVAGDADKTGNKQTLAEQLEETERQLLAERARPDTLEDYLTEVQRVFNHPSKYLRVKPGTVRVDRMGTKVTEASSGHGAEVHCARITIGNNPPLEGVLATFRRNDMQTERDQACTG